jgi:hypothetical protein
MSAPAPQLAGGRFALFADCLMVGVFTAVAALPVITAYPALVAACSVLRDRVIDDRSIGPRRYAKRFGQVVRSGPSGLLVPPVVAGVLALDAAAVAAGVPGSQPLAVLLAVAASVAAVLGLRAAASWRPGDRWPAVLRTVLSHHDAGGSALLWLAATAAVIIVAAVPLTAILAAGPLAIAAVAVDLRSR